MMVSRKKMSKDLKYIHGTCILIGWFIIASLVLRSLTVGLDQVGEGWTWKYSRSPGPEVLVWVIFEPDKAILQIVLPYWYEHIEIDGTNFTVHYGLLLVCHQNYIRTYDHRIILVLWIRFK